MFKISDAENISKKLTDIHEKCVANKDISEDKLKRYFHKSGILEDLGYQEEDIHVETTVKGQKRTDIHVTDDYGNVILVIEFKKPNVRYLEEHFDQLWHRYMKPLKAKYGILYNGFELSFYERIRNNYEKMFGINILDLTSENISKIVKNIQKPEYDLTQITVVSEYLKEFEYSEEKLNLKDDASREHFFANFKLKKDSSFGDLLKSTIDLFNNMESKGEFGFFKSAYDFWKISYAKKPDKTPKNWKPIMNECGLKSNQKDLYKFMFCLETTYALFTRLILAKSAEDYQFADIRFVNFIETKIKDASFRGDIPLASWAKITQDMISDMRSKLVSSVFEEDIFYWWTEPYEKQTYKELYKYSDIDDLTIAVDDFGEKIRKILLTFCKFDFSEIKGDPLGILYQRYFDKETRKALGEFYTPQEVVDYILDAVDYNGRMILEKRLLDPACGSGTFLVTALKRYLEASEVDADEKGWDWVLDNLCNNYRIVGFDIHPFATIMAQIQFMLVLLPYYKKAIKQDPRFVLMRVPIFRTDSLINESKTGKISLNDFEGGKRISMKVQLPVEEKDGTFFEESFLMPHSGTVLENTSILNNEEYFGALQGLFDVVKEQAIGMKESNQIPQFDKDRYENTLKKHYLSNKNWSEISTFFEPFGDDILMKIHRLQSEFNDGRLIKSIEDIFLAALLKNEQKYDFVVGNPPYVPIQTLDSQQKKQLESNYKSVQSGNYDLYLPFLERGLYWTLEQGLLGYINSNRYAKVNYGRDIRNIIVNEYIITQYVDFRDAEVFKDALNYPVINVFKNERDDNNIIKICRFYSLYDYQGDEGKILDDVKTVLKNIKKDEIIEKEYYDCFTILQNNLTDEWIFMPYNEKNVFDKISSELNTLKTVSKSSKTNSAIFEGTSTGQKPVFVVKKLADFGDEIQIKSNQDQEIYIIEKDIVRAYTDDAKKWIPSYEGLYAIFPYDGTSALDENQFKEIYPKAYSYLLKFKDDLKLRKSLAKSKNWYEYSAPRSLIKYDEEKYIINGFSKKSNLSHDEDGNCFFGPDIYGLQLKNEYKKYAQTIMCVINSPITNFYVKHVGVVHRGGSYKFEDRFIKNLPILLEESKYLECAVRTIKKYMRLKNKLHDFPSDYYTKLEELSEKNIVFKFNHKMIDISIGTNLESGYNIIIENGKKKKEKPLVVDTEEKANFVKLALDGKSVKKGEVIEILVPKSNRVVKNILAEYEHDKKELAKMPSIEELEEKIDQVVYDLYGLNEDDIKVIEEFLEKF